MSAISRDLLSWTAGHHGTITLDALFAQGVSRHSVERLVRTGVLERVLDGTYRFTGTPADHLARCVAACALRDDLVVAGPSSGRLWKTRRTLFDDFTYVIGPPASNPSRAPWLKTYALRCCHPATSSLDRMGFDSRHLRVLPSTSCAICRRPTSVR